MPIARPVAAGLLTLALLPLAFLPSEASGQSGAKARWERMAQIRQDKFDYVLPEAMRENEIDMWITVVKEGLPDPLSEDLGRGYVGSIGYYVFTDRGSGRIERVALGIGGYLLERNGAYDLVTSDFDLRAFVAERDPTRIGVNMSEQIGGADGLSHTSYEHLVETLGTPWNQRLVSAQKLVSD
ncbi:MAG: peptidase M24, partial [Gemmatimonadota bacterium]|nr:peptidase M24 [Gemmatimonadota bacterium]